MALQAVKQPTPYSARAARVIIMLRSLHARPISSSSFLKRPLIGHDTTFLVGFHVLRQSANAFTRPIYATFAVTIIGFNTANNATSEGVFAFTVPRSLCGDSPHIPRAVIIHERTIILNKGNAGRVRCENIRVCKMDVLAIFKLEGDRIDKIDCSGHISKLHGSFLSISGRRFAARIFIIVSTA